MSGERPGLPPRRREPGRGRARLVLAASIALAGCAPGCRHAEDARPPAFRSTVDLFEPPVPRPPSEHRATLLQQPSMRQMDGLLDQILAHPDQFGQRAVNDRSMLTRIESIFTLLGRLDDLVDLYRQLVGSSAATSVFAPRLAVLYTRLGLRVEARALLDPALESQVDNPDVQFATAYWLATGFAAGSPERARAQQQLDRALELDPDFPGIAFIDRDRLQALIGQ
jgi:tetratricopeptide (TPR) repeat protein